MRKLELFVCVVSFVIGMNNLFVSNYRYGILWMFISAVYLTLYNMESRK